MGDDVRICTNCGNRQAVGDFCERCGTRLPAVAAAPPAPATPPAPEAAAPAPAAPPAPEAAAPVQPVADQQTHSQAAQPAYQYQAQAQYFTPRAPGPFSKLFDLSFQGFVTRDSLRLLFTATLVLLGVYCLFALIFGIVAAVKLGGYWCLGIFTSLVLAAVMIIWTRIMMELTMTVSKMREDTQKVAEAKAPDTEGPKTE